MTLGRLGLLGGVLVGLLAGCGGDDASSSDMGPAVFVEDSNRATGGSGGSGPKGPPSDYGGSGHAAGSGSWNGGGSSSTGGGSGGTGQSGEIGGTSAAAGTGNSAGTGNAGDGGAAGEGGEAGSAGAGGDVVCPGVDLSQPTTLYLSADDSNSMASAALARGMIRNGKTPPAQIIRPYEFLNYYNVAYEAPAKGQINLVPQMRPGKMKGEYDLQIGVQSAKPDAVRRPMNLTLVLDTSGSMQGMPMTLMLAAGKALASQLQSGDIVSVTTWNTQSNVALSGHVVQGPNDPKLLSVLVSMQAGGGTDLHSGLVNGYELARKHYAESRTNRVVVISDGMANVGVTDEQMIGKEADIENKEGIYLVGVGVGDGVNDTLLNVVTDAGNGAYLYLDSVAEAKHMLADRFDEVVEIAARNVQVSMTMPSYFSIVKFSGEQYSTDPSKVKPQHLAPGDAMVISQTLRACSPSLVVPEDPIRFKASWVDPGSWLQKSVEVDSTVGEIQAQGDAQLRRGLAIVAYAEALKKGQTCFNRQSFVQDVLDAADAADPEKKDPALLEIRELVTAFGDLCP
jgi:Ca-activated chloride channel family protein